MARGFDHITHTARDLGAAQELFSRANLPVQKCMEHLIVGPDTALGATLAFERI